MSNQFDSGFNFSAALARCADEKIQFPGEIQSCGMLLACNKQGIIVQWGGQPSLFSLPSDQNWCGKPIQEIVGSEKYEEIIQNLNKLQKIHSVWHTHVRLFEQPQEIEVKAHQSNELIIIELLLATPEISGSTHFELLNSFASQTENLTTYAQFLVEVLQRQTGYQRIMVYQFDENWTGEVIAEASEDNFKKYLGLNFPSTDIPPQARELYLLNKVRILTDANAATCKLISSQSTCDISSLDLSHAQLRAMSKVHIEYLKNMGVTASCVVSIICNGKLWGLIACHHSMPYCPSFAVQQQILNAALLLETRIILDAENLRRVCLESASNLLYTLKTSLDMHRDLHQALIHADAQLMELVSATGIALVSKDRCETRGSVPPEYIIQQLVEVINNSDRRFYHSASAAYDFPILTDFHQVAAGLMATTFELDQPYWLFWFRPEAASTVHWAGDPRKQLQYDQKNEPLLVPRKSFDLWKEEVRGKSKPWSEIEVKCIQETVRTNLTEVLLHASKQKLYSTESELRLMQTVVETAKDAVLVLQEIDLEAVILYCNPAFERLTGIPRTQLIRKTAKELDLLLKTDHLNRQFKQLFDSREQVTVEQQAVRVDGTAFWAEVNVTPVLLGKEQNKSLIIIKRDISERVKTQEELTRNHQRLEAILAAVPDLFFLFDRNDFFEEIHTRHQELLIAPREQVLHKHIRDIVPSQVAELAIGALANCRATQEMQYFEYPMQIDNQDYWFEARIVPVDSASGLTLIVARDITNRINTVRSLNLANEQYRLLADAIMDVVAMKDLEGRLLYVSPSITRLIGYEPKEILGTTYVDWCHQEDLPGLHRAKEECQGGFTNYTEWRCKKKNGEWLWVESVTSPIFDSQGVLTSCVCCIRDISQRKQVEDQLRQAQKLEAVGQLAGGIAHDFNNLLTVVLGCCDVLLQNTDVNDQNREFVEDIKIAGERGAGLTQQLLAFSRQQMVQVQDLDLADIIQSSCKMLARLLGEDIELVTHCNDLTTTVRADPSQIQQVLMNLMVNARDAMPKGGKLTVTVGSRLITDDFSEFPTHGRAGKFATFAVEDTGGGIPEDVAKRIFEPFFTTKAPGKGTGLGLATVHGIISQAGGFIRMHTTLGKGTRFEVYLPDQNISLQKQLYRMEQKIQFLPNIPILVVEDEPGVRNLMRTILRKHGLEVMVASHAAEAFELCSSGKIIPQIVLTDVVIPGTSGRELVEQLKLRYPNMVAGYLSGYTADAILRHGVEEKAVDFLQKPFSPDALLHFVAKLYAKVPLTNGDGANI
ncbi:MAG: PAS domain S-box protein [Zavarzinella sp.]